MNRYETASAIKDSNEKRKLSTIITPTPEANTADVYIQTRSIERLDLLAYKFYNDQTLWYIIAAANGLTPNIIPRDVATPFPPRKFAKIGKTCPITAVKEAQS